MNLKRARKQKRMTQEELMAMSGVDQSTISALETGRMKRPSWEIVARLSRALDMDANDLFPVRENNGTAA